MPSKPVSANIVFAYYKDLARAADFYARVMGLELVVDQGFAKIFRVTDQSYIGLVDSEQGTLKASETKPVIIAFVTNEGRVLIDLDLLSVHLALTEAGADIPGAKAAAAAAGLKYIHIPFDGANPQAAVADAFLAAVTDKANQPVYIHCMSANRVGAMWLIKRMVVDGWDAKRASDEAATIGLTNPVLKQFALDYAALHRK